METILIGVSSNAEEILNYLDSSEDIQYETFSRDRLDGNSILSIAIAFSTTAFVSLSKVLIEYIKNKKITSIEYKGFKINNVSESKAISILDEIANSIKKEKNNEEEGNTRKNN